MPSYSVTKPLLNTSKPVVLLKTALPAHFHSIKTKSLKTHVSFLERVSSFSEVVRFFHSYAAAFLFLNLGTEKKTPHGAGEHTLAAAQAKLLDTDLRHCIKRSTKCSELEKNVGVCYLKTSLFFRGLEISLHPTLKREPKHELRHITDDAAMTTRAETHTKLPAHTHSPKSICLRQ